MIYLNFLFFIIAITVWGSAPVDFNGMFTPAQDILGLLVLGGVYLHYTRGRFLRLRAALDREEITPGEAEKSFNSRLNVQYALAIVFLGFETWVFNLKAFVSSVPLAGVSELFINLAGLFVFFLHLGVTWRWGYRTFGDVLRLAPSQRDYVRSNIRFNVAIIIPWAVLLLLFDALAIVAPSAEAYLHAPVAREIFFGLFLFVFAAVGPLLIVRLWDCEPLPPSEIKTEIIEFCRSRGVRFRDVVSWNALNKGLVTAGVMGLFARFRYLMITPALMSMLDREELMAVVSHEAAHVRKKHLVYYLLFFLGFIILSGSLLDWLLALFLTNPVFFSMFSPADQGVNMGMISFYTIVASLLLFILYFRFVFGYFIRNFERQADGFCFEAGINPRAMISSFMKLGARLGDDGKKSNWHHFNLAQRIEFLEKAMENPGLIRSHNQKVNRRLLLFVAGFIAFTAITVHYSGFGGDGFLKPERMAAILEEKLQENPGNPLILAHLGDAYFQMKEWRKAENAWEKSLSVQYHQPQVLNNLAWLLLTSEDVLQRDPNRALKLARDAAVLDKSSHILDTLAEAYYQNGMYPEAVRTAEKALEEGGENREYLLKQLEKMTKALKNPPVSPSRNQTI